jgi:predicted small metal-binding protein
MHGYIISIMSGFIYKCRDTGFDCSYEISEPSEKDIWNKVKIHNRYAHNQFDIPAEYEKKINDAIKEK